MERIRKKARVRMKAPSGKTKTILSGLTILAITTSSAMAADSASSASAEEVAPRLLDKLTASYTNVFYGPSISDPTSGQQPDAWSQNTGGSLDTKNYLSLGYKFSPSV